MPNGGIDRFGIFTNRTEAVLVNNDQQFISTALHPKRLQGYLDLCGYAMNSMLHEKRFRTHFTRNLPDISGANRKGILLVLPVLE